MSNNTQFSDIFSFTKENEPHLEKIAEKYPWSSIAQLFLLHHYKKNNSIQLEKQATKTALFFNNANWLNWQLHLLSKENEIKESKPEETSANAAEHGEQNEKTQQSLSGISSQVNTTEELTAGDEQTDKNIQQIAEHSNADAEVVTEAMANVLVKQNKTEKAIEVYEKLSLINPSKSAYFAAKIDSLSTDR